MPAKLSFPSLSLIVLIAAPHHTFAQSPEPDIVLDRTFSGIVGVTDSVSINAQGAVIGKFCEASTPSSSTATASGELGVDKVRELRHLIEAANRVKASFTRGTASNFTYQAIRGGILLQWEEGAGPAEVEKLESFIRVVLNDTMSRLGPDWKCPYLSRTERATAAPASRSLTTSRAPATLQPAQANQRWIYQCLDRDGDGLGSADTCVLASTSAATLVSATQRTAAASGLRYVANASDCNDFTPHLTHRCPSPTAVEIGYYQGLVFLLEAYPYDMSVRSIERYKAVYESLLRRTVVPMLAQDFHAVGEAATAAQDPLNGLGRRTSNAGRDTTLAAYCRAQPKRCPMSVDDVRLASRADVRRGVAQRFSKSFNSITLREYCVANRGTCHFPYGEDSPQDFAADSVEWTLRHGGVPMVLATLALDRVNGTMPTLGACSFGSANLGLGSLFDKAEFAAGNGFQTSLGSGLSPGADAAVGVFNQLASNAKNSLTTSSCRSSSSSTLLNRMDDPSLYGFFGPSEALAANTPTIGQGRRNIAQHETMSTVYYSFGAALGANLGISGIVQPGSTGTPAGRAAQAVGLALAGQGWTHDKAAEKWTNDVTQATALVDAYRKFDNAVAERDRAQKNYDDARKRYDDMGCASQSSAACKKVTDSVTNAEKDLAEKEKKLKDAEAEKKKQEEKSSDEAKKMAQTCRDKPDDPDCKDPKDDDSNDKRCPPDDFGSCCDAVSFGGANIGGVLGCATAAAQARQRLIEMFDSMRQPGAVDPSPIQDDGSGYHTIEPEDIEPYVNWGDVNLSQLRIPSKCIDPYVNPVRGYVPPDSVGGFSGCITGGGGGSTPSNSNCVGNLFNGVPGAGIGGMSALLARCPMPSQ